MNRTPRQAGFSLVELTIVVVILGVLATFAVPRFMSSVERSKAAEAFAYLSQVETAQARYNAEHGRYANRLRKLDIRVDKPQHFAVGRFQSSAWQVRWEMSLTRRGASSGYGRYTVVFNQDGFNRDRSTIPAALAPAE